LCTTSTAYQGCANTRGHPGFSRDYNRTRLVTFLIFLALIIRGDARACLASRTAQATSLNTVVSVDGIGVNSVERIVAVDTFSELAKELYILRQ
jgi:hypothetical protein